MLIKITYCICIKTVLQATKSDSKNLINLKLLVTLRTFGKRDSADTKGYPLRPNLAAEAKQERGVSNFPRAEFINKKGIPMLHRDAFKTLSLRKLGINVDYTVEVLGFISYCS